MSISPYDLSEWVGREEAHRVRGEAVEARAFEPRQRHGTVRPDRASRGDLQLAGGERERRRAVDELDAAVLKQLEPSPSSPSAPNSSSGASSGVTIVTPTSCREVVDEPCAREQRELVEGERPPGSARNGEDEALDLAGERVLEHLRQHGRLGRAAEAERAGKGDGRNRAGREQQEVERKLVAVGREEEVLLRVDGRHDAPCVASRLRPRRGAAAETPSVRSRQGVGGRETGSPAPRARPL